MSLPRSEIDSPTSAAVEQFSGLMKALDDDVTSLLKRAKEDSTTLSRRSAVRAVFAAIEGLVSGLKGMIIEPFPKCRHHYSDAEVALLREETYVLSNKGDAIAQTRFLRLEDNLRFAWKMFVREWDIDPEIDFSSDEWNAFCSSVKVRNRITHPRRLEDLNISDKEFAQVETGYRFVHSMTIRNLARALLAARHIEYEFMNRLLHPRALQWLDTLEQGGASPLARPITSEELRGLAEIESEFSIVIMRGLQALELIGDVDGIMTLRQKGADYRAWRLKNFQRHRTEGS